MTQDKYFMMMEQLGKEPIDSEVPPAWEDFPDIVLDAISTFNSLGDRIYPDIGYVGKDYTNLVYYLELHVIEDKEFFLDILSWLDARAIKKSSEQLKKQHDKLKRKK